MSEHDIVHEAEEAVERVDEVAEKVARRGIRAWRKDQYAFVFALILVTVISSAFLGDGPVGVITTLALMIVTLVVAMRTSDAGPRIQLWAMIVAVAALLLVTVTALTGLEGPTRLAYAITMLTLVVATPVVIARRIATHPTVSIETVTGAADIYLLLGLFFTTVYGLVGGLVAKAGQLPAQAFLVASRPIVPSDLVYFSFTTLTTVGYGDLTASTQIGRMLAITEALIGQLYLVTIVALLVANIGRARQPHADGSVGLRGNKR